MNITGISFNEYLLTIQVYVQHAQVKVQLNLNLPNSDEWEHLNEKKVCTYFNMHMI